MLPREGNLRHNFAGGVMADTVAHNAVFVLSGLAVAAAPAVSRHLVEPA